MKTQKQRIFSILAILTMAVILTCIFASCNKVKEKQVPVYKGMTISRSYANAFAMAASDDNGNHYGHFKGDHNDRDDEVDQNNPFEDPNAPSIEDKVNSTLDVVGAAESIYYADKNQDIFITIRLSNPDSYEILSFTLNGKKYSNYMFEDGSDMENLVLKVNVGDVGGIHDYTIDAIKYVDGTDIKDVRMDGDRTVKAGVRASDQTYVNVTNEQKTMTSISFDAQIVDLYSLIEKSGGYAKAVLYDGVNMLTKDIEVGEKTNIVFDNLTPNTVYQYGVVALYDNLSGNGVKLNTLYKKAVYTDTIVLFKDVQVGKECIEWGFVWNESFDSKQMSAISLWQNGAKVQDVDINTTRLDGLKSNNEYTLEATYKNLQNQDETISIEFVTYAKAVPTVEIASPTKTQTSVGFAINETDIDNVGAVTKIELINANGTVVADSLDIRDFTGLLSNNTYTVKVTYAYDLNDGVGSQEIVKTLDIKTEAKAMPVVEIVSPTKTQTSVGFAINETDTDNVGTVTKIELIHANGTVVADSLDVREFTGLLSDNTYTVKVTYAYDLNDGAGSQEIVKTLDIKTKAKTMPVVEIANPTKTDTTISVEHTFTDIDNVGNINSVKIYKGETLIAENTDKEIVFTNLEYYTEYKIVIAYSYDLNDGDGVHNQVFETTCKTNPHLVFNSCKIINTSAVSEGETIYMQATLDNPSGALPSSVVVNGQVYNCTGSTTASKIYIEIVNNGQFEGGNTTLFIEEINMTLDGATYTVKTDSNNSGTVFINGALSVESLKLVNKEREIVDYCMPGDEMYLLLTLNNKTGYTIDSVTINGSTITTLIKIDDEHYRIDRTLSNGWNYFSITSITYHNAYINKTLSVGNCYTNRVYKTNTSTVTEISTVGQLMNTKYNGGYYKLTADIDLSGIEWTNLGTFYGVFDGNGYKILNMSNVSTIVDKNVEIGLFRAGYGVFTNVKIEDITVMVTLNTTTSDTYDAFCGGFISGSDWSDDINAVFKNCTSTGDISVNNTTGGTAFAAGIVGYEFPYPDYLLVDGCEVNINISLKNGDKAIGTAAGIAGEFTWANLEIYVYNCTISGSITASNAQIINGETPWGTCVIDYKNNSCDIYLNGVRKTVVDDYYRYEE